MPACPSGRFPLRRPRRIHAVATLPGLCTWIVRGQRWQSLDPTTAGYSEDQPGAVEACARGRPRPGHSVLGGDTYRAARPAIEALALDYATAPHSSADEEPACDLQAAAFRGAGGSVTAVLYLHDASPEAVADSLGCSAVLAF